MKHYLQFKKTISNLVSDDENYIIMNDGKPIKINKIDEDAFEVRMDENLDCQEICGRKREKAEDDIFYSAYFSIVCHVYKDTNLKVIYLNNEEQQMIMCFSVKRSVKATINNIYLDYTKDIDLLVEYELNDLSKVTVNDFVNFNCNVNKYNNAYLDDQSSLEVNCLHLNNYKVLNKTNVYLYGPYAQAKLEMRCLNISGAEQEYDSCVYHMASNTDSKIMNYYVAENSSKIDAKSDIIVSKGIENYKTQKDVKGYVLDDDSQVNSTDIKTIEKDSDFDLNRFVDIFLLKIKDRKIRQYIEGKR
ncbi:MAG: SufD family Fe-S cluster assembly protein [Bacilli bacterium]